LAFKPNTNVIEESPAIKLIQELLRNGVRVTVYDPLAMDNTRAVFGAKIDYAKSARDCVARSDLCVITTRDKEFKDIDEAYIAHGHTTVIDCWRLLDPSRIGGRTRYIPLGVGYRTGLPPCKKASAKPQSRREVLGSREPALRGS
jgi:UDPglucose 6-dehydrogenase